MLQFLLVINFKWTHINKNKNKSLEELSDLVKNKCIKIKDNYEKKIKIMKENNKVLLMVKLRYPKDLHTLHNNYSLCSE